MNKKSQYFTDLEKLFQKAKKEEQIVVPKKSKDAIREMLNHEIQQMKTTSFADFWNKWRYQLIGLPTSAFMLFVVVYAATNMQFTMPKTEIITEPIVKDVVENVIEETATETIILEESETDEIQIEKLPRLKIDYSEDSEVPKEVRVLKEKIIQEYYEEFTEQEEIQDFEAYVDFINPDVLEDVTEFTFHVPVNEEPTKETTESDTANTENDVQTGGPVASSSTTQPADSSAGTADDQNDSTDDQDQTDQQQTQTDLVTEALTNPDITTTVERQTLVSIQDRLLYETTASTFTEFTKKDLIKDDFTFTVYTYVKDDVRKPRAFTADLLQGLSSSDTIEYIKISYLSRDEAIIEVKETGITKWYLFIYDDGIWSFQEYEKTSSIAVRAMVT